MKCFIGAKIITAEPLTLGEYNERRGWTIPANEDPNRPGYYIVYPDDYVSWSPKEVFDEAYRPVSAGERDLVGSYNPLQEIADENAVKAPTGDFLSRLKDEREDLDRRLGALNSYLTHNPGRPNPRHNAMLQTQAGLMSELLAVIDERLADIAISDRSAPVEEIPIGNEDDGA